MVCECDTAYRKEGVPATHGAVILPILVTEYSATDFFRVSRLDVHHVVSRLMTSLVIATGLVVVVVLVWWVGGFVGFVW